MVYVLLALSAVFSAAVSAACNWFAGWAVLWQLPLLFIGCFLGLVLLFLLVLVVSCLFVDPKKLVEKPSPYFRFLLNQFSRLAFDLGGVRVHVTGLDKVPRKGRFLLISNHLFAFDPIVFYYAMPWAELAFISKTENFSLYIVAQVMRKILCLPLDRNNDREALKAILKAIQFIKEDKASIAVFPEGGTSKSGLSAALPQRRVQNCAEGERSDCRLRAVEHKGNSQKHVPPPDRRASRCAGCDSGRNRRESQDNRGNRRLCAQDSLRGLSEARRRYGAAVLISKIAKQHPFFGCCFFKSIF